MQIGCFVCKRRFPRDEAKNTYQGPTAASRSLLRDPADTVLLETLAMPTTPPGAQVPYQEASPATARQLTHCSRRLGPNCKSAYQVASSSHVPVDAESLPKPLAQLRTPSVRPSESQSGTNSTTERITYQVLWAALPRKTCSSCTTPCRASP